MIRFSTSLVHRSIRLSPLLVYLLSSNKNMQPILKTYEHLKSKKQLQSTEQDKQLQKYQLDKSNEQLLKIRCQGCNVYLQSNNINKYGYIDKKVLEEAVEWNKKKIMQVYEEKAQNRDAKIMDFMHEVEKESGIIIFNQQNQKIQNLDNLEVMIRLQEKIDKYEEQEQLTKRSKKNRKDVLCFRCFSLKHHNRLPKQYDNNLGFSNDSTEFILNKIFNRHRNNQKINTHFFLVVDVFDLLGTMAEDLIHRLLHEKLTFSIIANKSDLITKKYLNETAIRQAIRHNLKAAFLTYLQKERQNVGDQEILRQQVLRNVETTHIFLLSTVSYEGYKQLSKFIVDSKSHLQLVGLPNTGKTTIINYLSKSTKSISKIPGTTVRVTQHEYGRGHNRKLYDMPGLFYPNLLYNLINKPSIKALLTWDKKVAPGILTQEAFIYGGKIQISDVRIIIFGLGGACSASNRWFIANVSEFWKGLLPIDQLKIKKYEKELEFTNGVAHDLQIAGYGFIGFRLCIPNIKKITKKLTFYLPQQVSFRFRPSVLATDNMIFHNKSAIMKHYMLDRLYTRPKKQKKVKESPKTIKLKEMKRKIVLTEEVVDQQLPTADEISQLIQLNRYDDEMEIEQDENEELSDIDSDNLK